jgi:type II secretory pathway pseudopilin PulG
MAAVAPEAAAGVAPSATLSVYKAARRIKRQQVSTLYSALRSVAEDAAFVFVADVAALCIWCSVLNRAIERHRLRGRVSTKASKSK